MSSKDIGSLVTFIMSTEHVANKQLALMKDFDRLHDLSKKMSQLSIDRNACEKHVERNSREVIEELSNENLKLKSENEELLKKIEGLEIARQEIKSEDRIADSVNPADRRAEVEEARRSGRIADSANPDRRTEVEEVRLSGLPQVQEVSHPQLHGKISDDCKSTGGHFNPLGKQYGAPAGNSQASRELLEYPVDFSECSVKFAYPPIIYADSWFHADGPRFIDDILWYPFTTFAAMISKDAAYRVFKELDRAKVIELANEKNDHFKNRWINQSFPFSNIETSLIETPVPGQKRKRDIIFEGSGFADVQYAIAKKVFRDDEQSRTKVLCFHTALALEIMSLTDRRQVECYAHTRFTAKEWKKFKRSTKMFFAYDSDEIRPVWQTGERIKLTTDGISFRHDSSQDTDFFYSALCLVTGDGIQGNVKFTQSIEGGNTRIEVNVAGLTPGHKFRIRMFGDLSDGCKSAGGYVSQFGKQHGAPEDKNHHSTELGTITADDDGSGKFMISNSLVSLIGANSVLGRSVAVLAGTDLRTGEGYGDVQPKKISNAGVCVATGVIKITK